MLQVGLRVETTMSFFRYSTTNAKIRTQCYSRQGNKRLTSRNKQNTRVQRSQDHYNVQDAGNKNSVSKMVQLGSSATHWARS